MELILGRDIKVIEVVGNRYRALAFSRQLKYHADNIGRRIGQTINRLFIRLKIAINDLITVWR